MFFFLIVMDDEEILEMKEKLIEEIDNRFPEEKKEVAKKEIEGMGKEEFLDFLRKNELVLEKKSGCPFCLISSGKIPSVVIDECEEGIAVLEINPISEGHSLVIPKGHIGNSSEFSENLNEFSKKISSMLEKLNPKKILVSPINFGGHIVVNLIPVYGNENENSPRKKASEEELKLVLEKIKGEGILDKGSIKKEKEVNSEEGFSEDSSDKKENVKEDFEMEKKDILKFPVRIP